MIELERRLTPVAEELLRGFRALIINGPRQSGKSTLVRQLRPHGEHVADLDEPGLLDQARADPVGFVRALPNGAAIDEFQRGGQPLLLAVKARLDADPTPGQLVLAGSTQFLAMRSIDETLTGRVGVLDLLPFSMSERAATSGDFLERAFDDDPVFPSPPAVDRSELSESIVTGGFPELALGPTSDRFRTAWCDSYLGTVTSAANVGQVADLRRRDALLPLLAELATRSSGELVPTDLARDVGLDPATVSSYVDVLRTLFLVRLLPAWTTSATGRAKRRPVVHLVDTALAAHLLGVTAADLTRLDSPWIGPLLESFVVGELQRQAAWAERPLRFGHYRDRDQREVDIIVERGRDVVAIEVKANATPRRAHARHLEFLRDRTGDRFRLGVVLHSGTQQFSLGERIVALPVAALWS